MVDVNERAEARHEYLGEERNRDRCVGRRLRQRGAGSRRWRSPSRGRLGSVGAGGLPGGASSSGLPKSPAAAISERRRSTPSGVSRCSRNPVDRGFALPGRSGPPQVISRPSAYTQARVLPFLTFLLSASDIAQRDSPLAAQKAQYQISSSPLAGLLGVAPIGGRPMKPVRRTKSRTLPIAEPVATATTSAVAATASSRRRRRWCAPERFRTSSQSAGPGVAGRRRSMLVRSSSVTFVPPPGECEAPCVRR